MTAAFILFPHQLFANHPAFRKKPGKIVLIEEPLFFGDPVYPARFHKQKLWLDRATMKRFSGQLSDDGNTVSYIDYRRDAALFDAVSNDLSQDGVDTILLTDPHDFILQKCIDRAAGKSGLDVESFVTPQLNRDYRESCKRWFMADFYKWQRKRSKIMVNEKGEPEGSEWSFDDENRKKVPKDMPTSSKRTRAGR